MPDFDAILDAARPVRAIVVGDDGAQAGQIAELLARVRGAPFEVLYTRRLSDALERDASESFDVLPQTPGSRTRTESKRSSS